MSDFLSGVLIGKAFSDGSGDGCGCGCWTFLFIGLFLFSIIMGFITDPFFLVIVLLNLGVLLGILLAIAAVIGGFIWLIVVIADKQAKKAEDDPNVTD